MAFYIRILEGPIPRQIFKITPGMRLGRSKGEIILPDSKISSLHAQIEADNRGLLFLVDKGSSNGIKVEGSKVKRLALAHGVKFTLGKTLFEVVHEGTEDEVTAAHDLGWRAVLSSQVPYLKFSSQKNPSTVVPFYNLLILDFLEGPQKGRQLELGFGPRTAGAGHLDIDLIEGRAQSECFRLYADGSSVKIKALQSGLILNSKSFDEHQVFEGDFLQIGETLIQMRFKND